MFQILHCLVLPAILSVTVLLHEAHYFPVSGVTGSVSCVLLPQLLICAIYCIVSIKCGLYNTFVLKPLCLIYQDWRM